MAPDGLETAYHVPQGEILSFKRGNSVYQVHADALGSVRSIAQANGTTVADFEYDSWGGLLASSGGLSSVVAQRFVGVLGTRADVDIGLIYMRHRWYAPEEHRFASRDPLSKTGLAMSESVMEHHYAYAKNRPLDLVDPYGLQGYPYDHPDQTPRLPGLTIRPSETSPRSPHCCSSQTSHMGWRGLQRRCAVFRVKRFGMPSVQCLPSTWMRQRRS